MQSNIFELIDLLVKMSGSTANLDELKAELDDTESRILKLQNKLDGLDAEMTDDKYFDASSEIVDRNIKISLVQKLHKLDKVKSEIEKELEKSEADEIACKRSLEDINEQISAANEVNVIINENPSPTDAYNNMIASENDRFAKLITKKEELEEESASLQRKTEYYGLQLQEINDKINKETERLDEVNYNLSNIKAYIDVESKEKDEKKYTDIKSQLEEAIAHKEEILNDAVFIAGSIKELIANDEKDKVDAEFARLLDVVKAIPYMELENDEITVEKEKLDEELKKYDEEISHKEYQTMDSEFIDERITYLREDIDRLTKKKEDLNAHVADITALNEQLSEKIYRAESQINRVDSSLIDYELFDFEGDKLSKTVVQASNNKLLEEKTNITEIADNYRKDLVSNIEEIKSINEKLELIEAELVEKNKELDELNKKIALSTKSTNILEEEKDKIKLENINKKITDLKNREEFDRSLSSIKDEFEMLFSSLDFVDKETRTQRHKEEPKEMNFDVVTEEDSKVSESVENTEESTSNEEPVLTDAPTEELVTESSEVSENKEDDVLPLLTPIDDESIFPVVNEEIKPEVNETEKLRVVEVLPITDNLKEKDDQDFMVSDFKDDDYVDINTAMTSVEEN